MKTNIVLLATVLSILNVQLSTAFAQGILTPPGAPAPTMKTLDQIAAMLDQRQAITGMNFTISSPGSYYLTNNLVVTNSANGINVSADNVTLDLNGFAILGQSNANLGITVAGIRTNLVVRNGMIAGFRNGDIWTITGSNCRFEHLIVSHSLTRGVYAGAGTALIDCSAYGNGSSGFEVLSACVISGCSAHNNGGNGIVAGAGSTITSSLAQSNTVNGFHLGEKTTINSSTAIGNQDIGIYAATNCTIIGCTVSGSPFDGISTPGGCLIKDCTLTGNRRGIIAGVGTMVSGCTVRGNSLSGILVNDNCVVLDNLCDANGTSGTDAGIFINGHSCRVEGNTTTTNKTTGIYTAFGSNFIARNIARGNATNFFLLANNIFGPTNTTSGVVTNHPWANFSLP